jgi:hypothetical protein
MQNKDQFLDNIQRPTAVPLFAVSIANLEPKTIYRNLHVPMLILDSTGKSDMQPFEQQNAELQKNHSS